jgi:hypothetical protein
LVFNMAKISVRYQINNAQSKYFPGMNISGKVWVESEESKDKKLKSVIARVMESYEVYETRKSGNTRTTTWWPEFNILLKHVIASKDTLLAGATKGFDFSLNLPNWQPKLEKDHRNWWLGIFFVQKTGLMATGGARPLDAVFILPCEGASAPMSIIQGVIGGFSRSSVEGAGSMMPEAAGGAASMDLGYASSLAQQAVSKMETDDAIGTSTIQRLASMFPKNDEILFKAMVRVGVEITAQQSQHWNSPVLASRNGMAYLEPYQSHWRFMFLPWIAVRSVKKAVKLGSSLDQVSGDVMFKIGKRSAFGRIYFKIMREGNEERSEMKQRKKEIRKLLPDLYKSAKRAQLGGEPVIMLFRGASGVGDPVHIEGPAPGDERVHSQAPDAELFPGYPQQTTPNPSPSFDFGAPASSQTTESFDEDWDEDWFEEKASSPAPAQAAPARPATDFLPSQKPTIDDSESKDWDWDEWED